MGERILGGGDWEGGSDYPAGRGGRKKIKDLWIDEKIPREQREVWPLVALGEEILWAPGLRSSVSFLADGQTTRFLQIRIRRDTET